MHTFHVYRHASLPERAVKVGYSWPCLFFGVFWLLFKRMWTVLLVTLAIMVMTASLESLASMLLPDMARVISAAMSLLSVVAWILVAAHGNRLYAWTLRARGYWLAMEVPAAGPEQALATGRRGADAPSIDSTITAKPRGLSIVASLLLATGALSAFIAAAFAFPMDQRAMLFGVLAGLFMVAGVVTASIARRAPPAVPPGGGAMAKATNAPVPDPMPARIEQRWRYGALAVLATFVVVLGGLLWRTSPDADKAGPIHPSVAFHLVVDASTPGAFPLPGRQPQGPASYTDASGNEQWWLQGEPIITADGIRSVDSTFSNEGMPALTIELTPAAAARLAEVTETNVGRQMAIVARQKVANHATIQGRIPDGRLQLTGLDIAEVQSLVREMHQQR